MWFLDLCITSIHVHNLSIRTGIGLLCLCRLSFGYQSRNSTWKNFVYLKYAFEEIESYLRWNMMCDLCAILLACTSIFSIFQKEKNLSYCVNIKMGIMTIITLYAVNKETIVKLLYILHAAPFLYQYVRRTKENVIKRHLSHSWIKICFMFIFTRQLHLSNNNSNIQLEHIISSICFIKMNFDQIQCLCLGFCADRMDNSL